MSALLLLLSKECTELRDRKITDLQAQLAPQQVYILELDSKTFCVPCVCTSAPAVHDEWISHALSYVPTLCIRNLMWLVGLCIYIHQNSTSCVVIYSVVTYIIHVYGYVRMILQ